MPAMSYIPAGCARFALNSLAAVFVISGCADAPSGGGGDNQQVGEDARIGSGDDLGPDDVGGSDGGAIDDLGGDGMAQQDAELPPVDDGVVDPDAAPPEPDAGPRPERLVASVLLTEIPQGESATAAVAVGAPVELNDEPGCVVVDVDPNAAPPARERDFDVGDVTVTGASGGDLVFARDGARLYVANRGVGDNVFDDGATLTASAPGGLHVDAFTLELAAPAQVRLGDPGFLEEHDRDDDLPVRWNAAGGTTVVVTVFPSGGDGSPERGNWVFCGAPDTGSFTVPAQQLSQVTPGAPFGVTAVVAVARTNVVTVDVGADLAVFAMSTTGGQAISLSR